jgi:Uma2 family endonuclease
MSNPNFTTTVEAPLSPVSAKVFPPEPIPLESRTDVTVDELERLSLPHSAELYDGRIVYKMPNFAHGVIQAKIAQRFNNYLEKNRIGLISGDANYRLWPDRNRESRAPDISFIRQERLPKNLDRFLPGSPDLAIEILSPTDSFEHVMEKVDEYLQQGVQIVWLVIPSTRRVLVCSPQGQYTEREVLSAPELLPGFELPVAEIFAGLEAKAE